MAQKPDLVKFVMCTLVSKDCIPFCEYIKCYVYPGNQGTHSELNQSLFSRSVETYRDDFIEFKAARVD